MAQVMQWNTARMEWVVLMTTTIDKAQDWLAYFRKQFVGQSFTYKMI